MPVPSIHLLLDLYDCRSPALRNAGVLDQIFADALQLAGFEMIDRSGGLTERSTAQVYVLRQAHAALHTMPDEGYVAADVFAVGDAGAVRPLLEIVRGYLAQKLMARSVQARLIERGLEAR